MEEWQVGLIGAGSGLVVFLLGDLAQSNRWKADRQWQRWAELVQLMEVYTSEKTSPETKKLAWARLNQLNLYDAMKHAEDQYERSLARGGSAGRAMPIEPKRISREEKRLQYLMEWVVFPIGSVIIGGAVAFVIDWLTSRLF